MDSWCSNHMRQHVLSVCSRNSINSLRTLVNATVAKRTQPASKVTPLIRSHLAKRHRSDSPVIWRPTDSMVPSTNTDRMQPRRESRMGWMDRKLGEARKFPFGP